MFWRKKTKVEQPKRKKRTKFINSKAVVVDVGVTKVMVDFEDGRSFICKIYGTYNQYIHPGQDETIEYGMKSPMEEPTVSSPYINPSLNIARYDIKNYKGSSTTFVDDVKSVKETVFGYPIKFEILGTEPYLDQVTEYFLEDIK